MTRPHIIRADTLDLQDKKSPTAQDHSKQPRHPAPLGIGPAAPHQAAAIRHAKEEQSAEEDRLSQSWTEARAEDSDDEHQRDLERDELAIRQNGGSTGAHDDAELADAEVDDGMDDDMMDKISSSPSIDDGGYSSRSPSPWPRRVSSLSPLPPLSLYSNPHYNLSQLSLCQRPSVQVGASSNSRNFSGSSASSSEYSTTPRHFPLSFQPSERIIEPVDNHHLRGGYPWKTGYLELNHTVDRFSDWISIDDFSDFSGSPDLDQMERIEEAEDATSAPKDDVLRGFLLPTDDPLLERSTSDWSIDDTEFVGGIPLSAAQVIVERMQQEELLTSPGPATTIDSRNASLYGPSVDQSHTQSTDNLLGRYPFLALSDTFSSFSSSGSTSSTGSNLSSGILLQDDDSHGSTSLKDLLSFDINLPEPERLLEIEDIDFEFVYALHTFVATVEGQANATKGDTMVLLDDSNSYWWLVRIVKDNSIGYLPAEHIETPTERLARLNKHRNIDLAATMLGDNAEKSKNPLKKAIRRRNAKTVQWSMTPIYVEASDYDYSSDEDEAEQELFPTSDDSEEKEQEDTHESAQVDPKVDPSKVNGTTKEQWADVEPTKVQAADEAISKANGDEPRSSEEIFDRPMGAKVTKNGTLRNTDSFFKDENAETRKITLTPNLLRDDSSSSASRSLERERGGSLDSLEKSSTGAEKLKEDKKKKDKKPGMLSGLFKRKDKKSKGSQDIDYAEEKTSEEISRSSLQKTRDEASLEAETTQPQPQRQVSKGKLQKPAKNRVEDPKGSTPDTAAQRPGSSQQQRPGSSARQNASAASMRIVSPEPESQQQQKVSMNGQIRSVDSNGAVQARPDSRNKPHGQEQSKPEQVKKAAQRVQLDDFDDERPAAASIVQPAEHQTGRSEPRIQTQLVKQDYSSGRLSESPVTVSPIEEPDPYKPPALVGDTSSQEDRDVSPVSPPSTPPPYTSMPPTSAQPSQRALSPIKTSLPAPSRPAPVPTELAAQQDKRDLTQPLQQHTQPNEQTSSPVPTSPSNSLPAWSDSSLRSYLDDGSDIRDMLMVVHDVSGVVPVGPDHPIMAGLFDQERDKVADLGAQLDGLLGEWLQRKRNGRTMHPNARRRSGGSISLSPKAAKPPVPF